MCGIYGYLGKGALGKCFEGLKKLEYRGYDSAGIVFAFEDKDDVGEKCLGNGLAYIKRLGEASKLQDEIRQIKSESIMAVGHTRWATHGGPSIENCHPIISPTKKWSVVHNGIIENHKELKTELGSKKYSSQTDTEVVAMLLDEETVDPLKAVANVCKKLKGSYALAIVNADYPQTIFVVRKNSPLFVGSGKGEGFVCSDLAGLWQAEEVYKLENENLAKIELGKVEIYDFDLNKICGQKPIVSHKEDQFDKGSYPHFMLKEICEIPEVVAKTVEKYEKTSKFAKIIPQNVWKSVNKFLIIGCGTAYHAGVVGGKIIEKECGIKCESVIASEFVFNEFLHPDNTLAIFVSQSGETADTLKALALCKEKGIKTLAITNVKQSAICMEADYVLYTYAGKEIAVASTKAFNCQVAVFYMLSAYLKEIKTGKRFLIDEVAKIGEVCEAIKNIDNAICTKIADKIFSCKDVYMIGRALDYSLAMEASLKLKEISYIHCEAYPAGELKHGTISLIENGTYCFAFVTQEACKDKTLANIREVESRGGKVIVLSQYDLNEKDFDMFVKLKTFDEKYYPLYAVVYMQLVAYHASCRLGNNPDMPRSLAKSVTVE